MQETDMVMELLQVLERRQCNGHAHVRLGRALADPDKFRNIFSRFSRGTYFENVNLDIEPVEPVVSCSCGYQGIPRSADELTTCPRCGGEPRLEEGDEFEIVEPEPQN
ncbi:MAG: hydrogenase maturation nickel metallochaperone HypA [Candidatus Nanohaloarchaea archaeon]|nr:hydrogenase maturation nickel metallochaperone HypA [Candidatus Nanohaloarchaea archaeon]